MLSLVLPLHIPESTLLTQSWPCHTGTNENAWCEESLPGRAPPIRLCNLLEGLSEITLVVEFWEEEEQEMSYGGRLSREPDTAF